jgi:uncharacterized protein YjbJ (UPF0337 family)
MKWDHIEGKWMQLKSSAKQYWPMLSEDDLQFVAGSRDKLETKLRERYAITPEESRNRVDSWLKTMDKPEAATGSQQQRPPIRQDPEHASRR